MFLKHIDLTTALRPSYLPDEVLLFVQDNVGLYEGKYKLPDQQEGQVYLTTHRICYVDRNAPRANSVAFNLRDVDTYELTARFLRSSPKITIVPKPSKRESLLASTSTTISAAPSHQRASATPPVRTQSAFRLPPEPSSVSTATWVCAICSFSNPVPSNFDPATANAHVPLPPCLACGIKPSLGQVLKAAINNTHKRPIALESPDVLASRTSEPNRFEIDQTRNSVKADVLDRDKTRRKGRQDDSLTCPRCTFTNHPSLISCEICGASLVSLQRAPVGEALASSFRADSPGPVRETGQSEAAAGTGAQVESIKISFRGGGEKVFLERMKGSMTQRKWLLQNAPPVPKNNQLPFGQPAEGNSANGPGTSRVKTAGIAGLEQLGVNMRKNNEILIGSAFEDLEALMASAKDVVALAERFARQNASAGSAISAEESALLADSAHQLGLVTTKDIVGGGGSSSSESLYLSELARNLAEFLTDDARGVLKKSGGIITLVDLWAVFNRARGGVELVSPTDFEKAAGLWESLKLPVRLRTFRSGVMVAQGSDRTDQVTIRSILGWLQDLHEFPPEQDTSWDWRQFGLGVTAQQTADRFGWSIGVAEEELFMAEEQGALCREEGLEGLRFWKNYIDMGDVKPRTTVTNSEDAALITARLKDVGLL